MDLIPNAITLAIAAHPMLQQAEHRLVPAGLTLAQTMQAQGLGGAGWQISVGGVSVPANRWHLVRVRPGHLVEIRATAGKSVLAIGAMIALSYLTFGAGLGAAAAFDLGLAGALGGFGVAIAQGAIMMAGSLVINKLLGPKAPAASAPAADAASASYSLAAGSNQSRLYAPLGLMLGESKVVPDLAAQQYTWFEGEDQYLACQLHAGINTASVEQIKVGDTLLSSYSDVTVRRNDFPAGNDAPFPSVSADSIAGALLDNPTTVAGGGAWVTRTTSVNTVRIAIDIEATLVNLNSSGAYEAQLVLVEIEYALAGSNNWMPFLIRNFEWGSVGTKPFRNTLSLGVPAGQYDVRLRKNSPNLTQSSRQNVVTWTQLKSFQLDIADYAGQPRVQIELKASGQLNGALNSVNWMARAAALPLWTGSEWITATEPGPAGTSNPGAQILQLLRGIRRPSDGRLLAGLGLPDRKIDLESLKAFMVRCAQKGFRFDAFIQEQMSITDLIDAVADVGFGRLSRASGKFGVIWLAEDQPVQGVINMARMKAKSFSVDYDLSPTADELEYQFYDADKGWVQTPVRVVDPTAVGTPQRTASLAVRGTTRAHLAALRARFTLGQSLYARKSITCELDLEHLVYPRGAVVALSHDLTQWGFSGRLRGFTRTASNFTLVLDEPLVTTGAAVRSMGLQLAGEANMRVYPVAAISADGRTVRIDAAWPADVPAPGARRPVRDTVWLYGVKATPGLRARVVSVVPNSKMTGAKVTFVPESYEFWDYVWNGSWTQPGNDSLLPVAPPAASNARITAERVRVGEAWRTQLTCTFDVVGNYDHAQVWGSADGAPAVLLGETGGTRVSWYADAGRQWSVEVRPFDGLGRVGGRATAVYNVAGNPPANTAGLGLGVTATGVVASWDVPAGEGAVDWSLTEIRRGPVFDTAEVIYSGRGTSVPLGWLVSGTTVVWARQKSTAGEWSAPVAASINIAVPAQPNVTATRDRALASFTWPACETSQPIAAYGVRIGPDFATAGAVDQVTATRYTRQETQAGVRKYWFTAYDVAGNGGAPGSATVETLATVEAALTDLGLHTDEELDKLREADSDALELLNGVAGDLSRAVGDFGTAITRQDELREGAVDKLAQSISLITAGGDAGFDAGKLFNFDGSAEGWYSLGATATWLNGVMRLVSTSGDPIFWSPPNLQIQGSKFATVKARIKRIAGTGWQGQIYYATAWHGDTEDFAKRIADPGLAVGDTKVVEWDMAALSAGGDDWVASTINAIRLDLGSSPDDVFDVDWVAIGRNSPGASMAAIQDLQTALSKVDEASAVARRAIVARLDDPETGLGGQAAALDLLEGRVKTTEKGVSSQAEQTRVLQAFAGRIKDYRLVAQGVSAAPPVSRGVYDADGTLLAQQGRSWATFGLNPDGTLRDFHTWDVYDLNSGQGAALAAALMANSLGTFTGFVTFDEPSTGIGAGTSLRSALLDYGASEGGLTAIQYRGAYILLGQRGLGAGGGIEKVALTGGADAWTDLQMQVVNGRVVGLGGNAGIGASVSQVAKALATTDGKFESSLNFAVDANGHIAAVRLGSNGAYSQITMTANALAFVLPGAARDDPGVQLLTAGLVGGVPSVGIAGNLYLDGAIKGRSIDVDSLFARVAYLPLVMGARIQMESDGSGGWGYIRRGTKWLDDGKDGYVLATHPTDGTFVEVRGGKSLLRVRDGDFRLETPGFSVINGITTIAQANVIGTLQLQGNSVNVPVSSTGANQIAGAGFFQDVLDCYVGMPYAGVLYINFSAIQGFASGPRSFGLRILINGVIWFDSGLIGPALQPLISATASQPIGPGSHHVIVQWVGDANSGIELGARTIFAQGTMR